MPWPNAGVAPGRSPRGLMADWGGVDGCREGWVLAVVDAARRIVVLRVLRTFAEVALETQNVSLTLADIPIGLPSGESARERLCDAIARKELGPRASTVFPVPAREAVWADSYAEACRRNEKILGRKLSKQSWGICPKIREVDAVLRIAPKLQERIRETHPELCFRWLNRGKIIEDPKRSQAGRRIRRELLEQWTTNLETALQQARRAHRRREAAPDDLLDAVAAAVVARLAGEGQVKSVPLAPERDAAGLRMEIVGI